ncbi:hypothetical protein ABK040_004975 [Willaertia magna]
MILLLSILVVVFGILYWYFTSKNSTNKSSSSLSSPTTTTIQQQEDQQQSSSTSSLTNLSSLNKKKKSPKLEKLTNELLLLEWNIHQTNTKNSNTTYIDDTIEQVIFSNLNIGLLKLNNNIIRIYKNDLKQLNKYIDIKIGEKNDYSNYITINDEGTLLAVSIDYDNYIKIFKINNNNTYELFKILNKEKSTINRIEFLNNNILIYQLNKSDEIIINYLNDLNKIERIKTGQLENYMFHCNGQLNDIALAGFSTILKIYHLKNIENNKKNTLQQNYIVNNVNGHHSSILKVHFYNNYLITKWKCIKEISFEKEIKFLFICNENVICIITKENEILFYDILNNKYLEKILITTYFNQEIKSAKLNPKRKLLVTASTDGMIRLWKVPTTI